MMFGLTINCDGAAFTHVTNDEQNGKPNPGPEVARILRDLADKYENERFDPLWSTRNIFDVNGANVGTAQLTLRDISIYDDREV